MAITRAQQVRQMLEDGGMLVSPSKDGKRPGYRRSNYDTSGGGLRSSNKKEDTGPKTSGSGKGRQDPMGGFANVTSEQMRKTDPVQFGGGDKNLALFSGGRDEQYEGTTEMGDVGVVPLPTKEEQKILKKTLRDKNPNPFLDFFNPIKRLYNITPNDPGTELRFLSRLTPAQASKLSPALQAKYQELIAAEDADAFGDPSTLEDLYNTKFTFTEFDDLKNFGDNDFAKYAGEQEGKFGLLLGGNVGNIEVFKKADGTYGYREKTGGDDDPILFPQGTAPGDPNQNPGDGGGGSGNTQTGGGIAFRLMSRGGSPMDAPTEGGIMDLETGRQMYFLGKLVKKATRAVKKIAKSPIGKAAILGGAMYFGKNPGTLGKFFGTGTLNPFKTKIPGVGNMSSGLGKLLSKVGLTDFVTGDLTTFGKFGIPFALLPFLTEEEQEQIASGRGVNIDPGYIRGNPMTFASQVGSGSGTAFALAADGGRIGYQEGSKEPVAKKTMPLLDMDGKEMDLRDDGGFVPIGRMEKADDVPARLSKNEFVFTADAVRNAGGGDVDKGAEVMYNMMKNLESGGQVSEESQGLEGAREMFQTSKRLEEVL
jgi:hypothetical protein